MIYKYFILMMIAVFFYGCAEDVKVPESVELKTWQDSISYSIGFDVGKSFSDRELEFKFSDFNKGFIETYSKDSSYAFGASLASNLMLQGIEVNPIIVLTAFERTNVGDSMQLTEDVISTVLKEYNVQLREESEKRAQKRAKKNKEDGIAFLEDYKANHDDEIVTDSGLVYRILNEGYGDKPNIEDRVVVHYTGKLIDDKVFDSSIERGEPIAFAANGVIKGWQEALLLMPVGSKWEIVIPSELGYGDRAGGKIPANSTLIFEVELLGIE